MTSLPKESPLEGQNDARPARITRASIRKHKRHKIDLGQAGCVLRISSRAEICRLAAYCDANGIICYSGLCLKYQTMMGLLSLSGLLRDVRPAGAHTLEGSRRS